MATLTRNQIIDIINRGETVIMHCGTSVYEISELSQVPASDGDIAACVATPHASNRTNANYLANILVYGTPTDGQTLVYDATDGRFEFATPSGGGGGSGTVNTGAANKLAFYPSAGTTVDDAAGLTYQNASPNLAIVAQDNAHTALNIRPATDATSAVQFQVEAVTDGIIINTDITGSIGPLYDALQVYPKGSYGSASIGIAGKSTTLGSGALYLYGDLTSMPSGSIRMNAASMTPVDMQTLAAGMAMRTGGVGGISIIASNAAGSIKFTTGSLATTNKRLDISSAGNAVFSPGTRTGTATPYFQIQSPADTALTASTESIGIRIGGDVTGGAVSRQYDTGALSLHREIHLVGPTLGFVGASTAARVITLEVESPKPGTNATLTNSHAIRAIASAAGHIPLLVDQPASSPTANIVEVLRNNAIAFQVNSSGIAGSPGGTRSWKYGNCSTTAVTDSVYIGDLSGAPTNNNMVVIGSSISGSTFGSSVVIGGGNTVSNNLFDSVIIGYQAGGSVNTSGAVILGRGATSRGTNMFVAGSSSYPINDVYFGKGVYDASPMAYAINGVGGSGTNIAGANLNLYAGIGTGTGIPGKINAQFARAGSSSSTANTRSDSFELGYSTTDTLSLLAKIKTSTTAEQDAASILFSWLDPTHGSRTGNIIFNTVNNAGSLTERLQLTHNGLVIPEISSSATPSANKVHLYAKDAAGISSLFFKKDDGTEVEIGTGGGSGTVNSGTAKRLAHYAATGTAVSDTPGLEYQSGASPNVAITAQNDAHKGLLIKPFSDSYSEAPLVIDSLTNGATITFDPGSNASPFFDTVAIQAKGTYTGAGLTVSGNGADGSGTIQVIDTSPSTTALRYAAIGASGAGSTLINIASSAYIRATGVGGLSIVTSNASGLLRFGIGGTATTNLRATLGATYFSYSPHGTGAGNTLELRFLELAANGAHYVGFKAPDAITSDRIWTLPSADGSSGYALTTNGSGVLAFSEVVTPSSTSTLTNKTFDVEATGNSLTVTEKLWLPAAGANAGTAAPIWDIPASGGAVAAVVAGTNVLKGVLDFADAGVASAQNTIELPSDFTGTVDARIIWHTAATSGDCKWSLATCFTATDGTETDDPSFNTASTVTTTAPGTANRIVTSAITGVTITGNGVNKLMHLKISRDPSDGADTLGNTARLVGVEITLRRAM